MKLDLIRLENEFNSVMDDIDSDSVNQYVIIQSTIAELEELVDTLKKTADRTLMFARKRVLNNVDTHDMKL